MNQFLEIFGLVAVFLITTIVIGSMFCIVAQWLLPATTKPVCSRNITGQHVMGQCKKCLMCGEDEKTTAIYSFWHWLANLGKKVDRAVITEEYEEWAVAKIQDRTFTSAHYYPAILMVMYIEETGFSPFKNDDDGQEALRFLVEQKEYRAQDIQIIIEPLPPLKRKS